MTITLQTQEPLNTDEAFRFVPMYDPTKSWKPLIPVSARSLILDWELDIPTEPDGVNRYLQYINEARKLFPTIKTLSVYDVVFNEPWPNKREDQWKARIEAMIPVFQACDYICVNLTRYYHPNDPGWSSDLQTQFYHDCGLAALKVGYDLGLPVVAHIGYRFHEGNVIGVAMTKISRSTMVGDLKQILSLRYKPSRLWPAKTIRKVNVWSDELYYWNLAQQPTNPNIGTAQEPWWERAKVAYRSETLESLESGILTSFSSIREGVGRLT